MVPFHVQNSGKEGNTSNPNEITKRAKEESEKKGRDKMRGTGGGTRGTGALCAQLETSRLGHGAHTLEGLVLDASDGESVYFEARGTEHLALELCTHRGLFIRLEVCGQGKGALQHRRHFVGQLADLPPNHLGLGVLAEGAHVSPQTRGQTLPRRMYDTNDLWTHSMLYDMIPRYVQDKLLCVRNNPDKPDV